MVIGSPMFFLDMFFFGNGRNQHTTFLMLLQKKPIPKKYITGGCSKMETVEIVESYKYQTYAFRRLL